MARLFRRRGAAEPAPQQAVEPTVVPGAPAQLNVAVEPVADIDDADALSSDQVPAKRRRWLGPVQIIVVLALILGALFYARAPGRGGGPPPTFANMQEDPLPIVNIARPVAAPTTIKVHATGTVNVRNYVALTPQVGGRVVTVSPELRAGGTFSAGDQLLVIDRKDFELALDQARADIAAAQSSLMLQRAESDAARANYALLHPNEEVPPLIARIPQIAQARAQLSAARARTEIAALNLRRTSFSLPFDGRITESTAEVGQVLIAGQSFGRAFAFDALEVVVPIAADELDRISPPIGRSATVLAAEQTLTAAIERVSAELDERTRFAELYLRFAPEADPPPPGTFVDVVLQGPDIERTYLLPAAAEQINRSVWVVAQGILEPVMPRTLGNTSTGWVVDAFDYKDGIVLGAVPGAEAGLPVDIGSEARARFGDGARGVE